MLGALSQRDKGREKPQKALELRQNAGICGVPREGGSLQPLLTPRKANWNAMGHPLSFGELGVCLLLPVGFEGVLLSGR